MEFVFAILPLILVVGVLGIVWYLAHRYEQKRSLGLSAVAEELSLEFSKEGNTLVQQSLSHLPLMQRGRGQTLTNLISGQTQDVDLSVFDYSYVTGHGKSRTTHKHTIVAFQSPLLDLPSFDLGPEGFFHKIASTFGYQDIDFDGYPTFNKKYLLRGPDEPAIRELFTENVVQHFEAELADQKKMCQVFGQGPLLLVYNKPRLKPPDIRPFLERAFATYGALKSIPAEHASAHFDESSD